MHNIQQTLEEIKEFSNLIASIGKNNHNSLCWWASSISSKNFGASEIWERINSYLETKQITDYPKYTLSHFANIILKAIYRSRLIAPLSLRKQVYCLISKSDNPSHLFITHFSNISINKSEEKTYDDIYWGKLIRFLKERNEYFILVGLNTSGICEKTITEFSSENMSNNVLIFPIEVFITPIDVLKSFYYSLTGAINLPHNVYFQNQNIFPVLKAHYKFEKYSGEIFSNILFFFAFKRLFHRLKPARIYWPWENHSWEKMLILASRSVSPQSRLIGHQHTTIPPYLWNHFPGYEELKFAPYPDKIITTGINSLQILKKYGNFPEKCLVPGAMIRDSLIISSDYTWTRKKISTIGVALPIHLNLAFDIIKDISFLANEGFNILFRPHPLCDKRIFNYIIKNNNIEIPQGQLEDFLKKCDCLIYVDSTVSFHALRFGIPLISCQFNRCYNYDPLFEAEGLKWTAYDAEQLLSIIREIDELSDDTFQVLKQKGIQYVKQYHLQPTPERLEIFLIS